MSEFALSPDERIRQAADRLFAEAKHISEITYEQVLALTDGPCGRSAFKRVFPGNAFIHRRRVWLRERIEQAMDTAFAKAVFPSDVTFQQIADLAGCGIDSVKRLAGAQFRTRRQTIATPQQRAFQVIEQLVEAKVPLSEYSWKRVLKEIGKRGRRMHPTNELLQAFRDGREKLANYHRQNQQQRVPGAAYACIQGDWINVDEATWYLPSLKRTLRRDQLRSDIAALAWPLLREEALMTSPSAATLNVHYRNCLFVERLLGDTIPDIRALTLETLQQTWLRMETSEQMRKQGRTMLTRMLATLIAQEGTASTVQAQEYARAIHWLEAIRMKRDSSAKSYLSETELDAVLDGCLEDIIQGLTSFQHGSSGNGIVPSGQCTQEVEVVLHWGVALIILVMAFTGLRRQSIVRLTVDDLAKLGPHAFALAWQHGKPGKQQIAIIPALVADHIQHYIHATASIRDYLSTRQIFFARNQMARWDQMTVHRVSKTFESFVRRHALQHAGSPLRLGSTLLRRTYVTRALYAFPSIAALQAQLGHSDPKTTLLYAQFDRYGHPAKVDNALDAFGRKVLVRWHRPLLLESLPDAERQSLLGAQVAHSQEVGMCRHNSCVKLDEEHLPPCSLCEHLVSGPEYLLAWEREKVHREQQLEYLAKTPEAELLFAQMKGQYDRFLVNYQFIQERSQT